MGKLEGKVAVVTGGTAGIGIGITQVFLEEGAKVVFCGRREERGREIEAGYRAEGYDATFVRCDMTVEQDVQNLLDRTVNTYGKVDILVNNAGVMHPFPITDMDMAKDYDAVMNVNIRAYFLATKLFSNAIGEGGSIVNIASVGGLGAAPTLSTYAASKAATISLTKSSGVELAPKGIRVNAICPGTIFSEMMPRDGEFTGSTLSRIPMGRGGEPREIGTVAAFLASDEASYVTATYIVVDGGMVA
ncbi:SDR family NAD(P)-dependent oxidoreductase [Collinsella ihumii]|uniref:Glucose 1-dehydrogenase n=1 Tax=Collinsella ihumii TaxID=1720204 RepID=A0ABT7XBU7_9ACTN|nr:glucose 1-dehydrogenase [Collinsella ihumii]MDN0062879.1 glucose 1-dehydrogenase [Collinsella ihumii]